MEEEEEKEEEETEIEEVEEEEKKVEEEEKDEGEERGERRRRKRKRNTRKRKKWRRRKEKKEQQTEAKEDGERTTVSVSENIARGDSNAVRESTLFFLSLSLSPLSFSLFLSGQVHKKKKKRSNGRSPFIIFMKQVLPSFYERCQSRSML